MRIMTFWDHLRRGGDVLGVEGREAAIVSDSGDVGRVDPPQAHCQPSQKQEAGKDAEVIGGNAGKCGEMLWRENKRKYAGKCIIPPPWSQRSVSGRRRASPTYRPRSDPKHTRDPPGGKKKKGEQIFWMFLVPLPPSGASRGLGVPWTREKGLISRGSGSENLMMYRTVAGTGAGNGRGYHCDWESLQSLRSMSRGRSGRQVQSILILVENSRVFSLP